MLSKRKEAMPHLQNQNRKAFDLYFELLSPEDRIAIFEDLKRGIVVRLPNFGMVEERVIANSLRNIKWSDLDANSIDYMSKILRLPVRNQILAYDRKTHTYRLR